jgi:Uncharacterized protein conserved in bacteria
MRWRLYIFLLSATAVFCFMLLTATTDYTFRSGSAGVRRTAQNAPSTSASVRLLTAVVAEPEVKQVATPQKRDVLLGLKPNQLRPFVPQSADPVFARHEAEREERINRGKPANRHRLKWDERGWYREEVALVTAYCPCARCCGTGSPGITSIGKNAWTPGLAAEPNYLGYGTKVFVPGYGYSEVDDTGGAMRRHWRQNGLLHIDVRMTYHHEARQWGKQYLRVKIYETN